MSTYTSRQLENVSGLDSVHLKSSWPPVTQNARSWRSYEKYMGDCEQSEHLQETKTKLGYDGSE